MLVTAELLLRLTPEERDELRATLRREDLSPRVRERLEMVKAADLGHDLGQITALRGGPPPTRRPRVGAAPRGGGGGVACAAPPGWGGPVGGGAPSRRARGEPGDPPPRRGWAWASRCGPQ